MTATAGPVELAALPRAKVNLVGCNGNAFAILATVDRALRKAGWTPEQRTTFRAEAKSGDYQHLLATAMKYSDDSGDGDGG